MNSEDEQTLLNTKLFKWEYGDDEGKILNLKGTNIYVISISPSIWLRKDVAPSGYKVIYNFEEILDSIDEFHGEIAKNILFHLDIFL
jgi:hypothetical protein